MTIRIAFDLDGVLRDLVSRALTIRYAFREGTEEPADIVTFNKLGEVFGGKGRLREFLDRNRIWRDASPHRSFVDLWARFARRNSRLHVHPLVVSTNTHVVGIGQSVAWMREHLPAPAHGGLEIHFCNDKRDVSYTALIEDKYENVMDVSGPGSNRVVFVPNRPWTGWRLNAAVACPRIISAGVNETDEDTCKRIVEWVQGKRKASKVTP